MSFLSIFSITYIIKKKILFQNSKILLSALFFWIILIISSIYSDYKMIPIMKSISYIRFLLFALGLYLLFQYKKEYLRIFLYVIFFSILILFFDTLIQLFFKKNIFGYKLIQPERPSSFFKDELKLGSYIVRFLPIFFSLYFLNLIKNKSIFFIIFFLSVILIILSGERSSVFMLSLFILGILFFLKNFLRGKIIIFLGIFLIFLLSLNFSPTIKKRLIFDSIKDFKNEDKIFIFS